MDLIFKNIYSDKFIKGILDKLEELLILVGVLLVLFQFGYNRSLWMDEAALALNIISKGYLELLKPLDHFQMAPPLFLLIEKISVSIFGKSEYALRAFPLLLYISSLFLFFHINKILIPNLFSRIIVLFAFVFNTLLIYYATEVKQYIGDVFISLGLIFLLISNFKNQNFRYFYLIFFGSTAVFLSSIAPIIMFTAWIFLILNSILTKRKLLILSLVWGVSFSFYFYFFVYGHPMRDFMIEYWGNRGSFMPLDFFSFEFLEYVRRKNFMFSRTVMSMGPLLIIPAYFIYILGIGFLCVQKKYSLIILLISPLFLHFLLSGFKIYLVEERSVLYLYPLFLIAFGTGLSNLIHKSLNFEDIVKKSTPFAFVFILSFSILKIIYNGFPLRIEEIKESLDYIDKGFGPDDSFLIMEFASNAFLYYESANPKLFYKDREIYLNQTPIEFLEPIKHSTQGSLWVLFSHVDSKNEILFLEKADSIGLNGNLIHKTKGFKTYLFTR